ncbi:MAG: hypothetical protein J5874_05455 [Oscillospiraceae bacterium]|nr:hypothetical protein [Oscillospiraceae bacterium]
MTLFEDLWYGNVNPHEAILTENRRFKHLLSLMGRKRDELNETLTEKQAETLEKYDAAVNEMHSFSEVEAFSYGFRLGVRFMIEAVVIKEIP